LIRGFDPPRYFDVVHESSLLAAAAVFSHGCAIRTWAAIRARNVDPALDLDHDLENTR
jgi:hypothetical protein